MTPTEAHAASLPLFSIAQGLRSSPAWDASASLSDVIRKLGLSEDLLVIIFIGEKGTTVDLKPLTEYGLSVVQELRFRSECEPCPEPTSCVFDDSRFCKWCGRVRK